MVQYTVSDLPLISAVMVSQSTAISDAELQMLQENAKEVFVTTDSHRVLGIVPDYEFLKYRITPIDAHWTVSSIMSPVSMVLPSSALIETAARQFRSHIWSRIAIVDENRLTGILTRTAVLMFLSDGFASDREVEASTSREVEAIAPEKPISQIPNPKFLDRQHAKRRTQRR